MIIKRLFICFSTLLFYIPVNAQSELTSDSVDVFIKNKMQQLRIPALQLGVIQKGKLVKLSSYGMANPENSVPATDESLFSINSCTKAFVGVAVMQLQEDGKLNINDPVSKYLDSLPEAWNKVTIKQVLANNSGLPNIIDEQEKVLGNGDEASAWAKVKTLPVQFQAGEKYSYNQTGYVMLGMIINKLSGVHFTKFIEERQFKVAGMKLTRFGDAHDVIPHSAGAYSTVSNVNGQWISNGDLTTAYVEFPLFFRTASGMISNAGEIAEWIIALEHGQLLKQKSSLELLWAAALMNNGKPEGLNNFLNGYALGWPVIVRDEHPAVAPVGGMRNSFFVYPKDELSVIVLTNLQGANPEYFIDEIAGYYLSGLKESNGFGLSPAVKALRKELIKQQYNNALKTAQQLKKKHGADFILKEDDINAFGYRLLGEHKMQEAVKVFKLYTALYPKSSNAYDSYAEALAATGNKTEAIKNYRRSFELNSKNTNAAQQLKKLEGI
ncbi:serine hydrolase domain-containing protein [Pedobacter sp. UYP1]|uniref:serine hydrolase domain-containing protein n=1 Tax=Pedobacter sp. UYP1 TaxID=1756396 RepID=UPI0033947EE0